MMHEAMVVQVVAQSAAVTGAVAASGVAFAAVTLPNGAGSSAPDNPFAAAAARRSADAERADGPAAEAAAGSSASPAVDRAAAISSAADMPLNAAASARVWKAPSMSDAYALFDDKSNHSSPRAGDLVCDARLPAAGRRPSLGKSSMSNMCAFLMPAFDSVVDSASCMRLASMLPGRPPVTAMHTPAANAFFQDGMACESVTPHSCLTTLGT